MLKVFFEKLMKKYDDPGDDKQICQKTGEGKNLDEGDWKTLEIFYDSTKISWVDQNTENINDDDTGDAAAADDVVVEAKETFRSPRTLMIHYVSTCLPLGSE